LWTGKVQFDWRPNDDVLLYAGVNRGVKAGSFNAPLIGAWNGAAVSLASRGLDPNSFIPYKEEVLVAYEGGFKVNVWDNRARINGAAFYYDYSDYQAFLFTGIGGNVINADAENIGFELDMQVNPIDGLDAIFGVSWFDATVEDVPLRIGSTILRDVDPTYAPEFQYSGLLRYQWPAFGGKLSVQGDASYSDEFFYNLRNYDADKFSSYVMVNTRLAWVSDDGHWEGAFSVRNVTDTDAGILGFDLATACGCNEVSYQPPRWFGFNIRYNF
jgi:iron complex outermembrane receptor protein